MKKHLEDIKDIIIKFKRKYKFNENYLKIKGSVYSNVYSRLKIKCNTELDNFTLKRIKSIEEEIYENIRKYLDKNKIKSELYIYPTISSDGWSVRNHIIYFREQINV